MTVRLLILFKPGAKSASFERNFQRSLDLLGKLPDVQRVQEGRVLGGPAGLASYYRLIECFFTTFDALDAALTSPEGVAAGKDLMRFAGKHVELLFVEDRTPQGEPLTPDDLQAYLDEHAIPAEIVFPGKPTPTVMAAALALDVAPEQIVKSLVFLVDDRPFLIYGCGLRRVDPAKLAARLNVAVDVVRPANADEVLALTGYAVGSVPPLGLKTPMPVFMDTAVQAHETVYAGGGGRNALLRIRAADLLRASKAEVAELLQDAPAKPVPTDEPGEVAPAPGADAASDAADAAGPGDSPDA